MLQAGWSAKEHRGRIRKQDEHLGRSLITKALEYQAKESGLDSIGNKELSKVSE